MRPVPVDPHLAQLRSALERFDDAVPLLRSWGVRAADRLLSGGRLLAAGNGGSAAQAEHLTAELVGRYAAERAALSAISLHAESSTITAVANDYGYEQSFARQVRAHGRPGDVLVLLSTSGESPNLVAAADVGRSLGLRVWALTGPGPNTLARTAEEAVEVTASSTATVQELHLVAVHLLASAAEEAVRDRGMADDAVAPLPGGGVP